MMRFLEEMREQFELVVFTASRHEYADRVLDAIDPKNTLFAARFYRHDCIPFDGTP